MYFIGNVGDDAHLNPVLAAAGVPPHEMYFIGNVGDDAHLNPVLAAAGFPPRMKCTSLEMLAMTPI